MNPFRLSIMELHKRFFVCSYSMEGRNKNGKETVSSRIKKAIRHDD